MTMKASSYPSVGCVVIVQHHETNGITGWHGNDHNDADGWYWFQASLGHAGPVSAVFHKRRYAMRDAEKTFPNIVGWVEDHSNYWTALIRAGQQELP